MPEQDNSGAPEPLGPASDARNLPVPVSQRGLMRPGGPRGWVVGALRLSFGWKTGSIRANLTDVLKAGAGETGFSPKESVMLQNILGLRERRGVGVMVPRAAIIAAQQEMGLGGLMR